MRDGCIPSVAQSTCLKPEMSQYFHTKQSSTTCDLAETSMTCSSLQVLPDSVKVTLVKVSGECLHQSLPLHQDG